MAELIDETSALESTTVGVYRTAATVKGGRRFSFGALVVVGDRTGRVGVGYGKANMVPPAIEKAQKEARRRMRPYPLQGRTIPHVVTGRFGACVVRLIPASPGTGVIAGAAVRAPLEMLGVQDCLTKSYGSNNPKNLVKAVIKGFEQLRSKEDVGELRGTELERTEVEEAIARSGPQAAARTEARVSKPAAGAEGRGRRKRGTRTPRGGRSTGKSPRAETPVAKAKVDSPKAEPAEVER